MDKLPGEDAQPLTGLDKDRWDAAKQAIDALSEAAKDGTLDAETLAGGARALKQIPLDLEKVREALNVPSDAGEYEEGLTRILRRIPDGWGRWISCDKGWYPLLVETDRKLSQVCPEYQVNQVKEKYGTLRYYWGFADLKPDCCLERDETDPRPVKGSVDPKWAPLNRTEAEQEALNRWWVRELAHLESPEHENAMTALEPQRLAREALGEQLRQIVAEAEDQSARMCELCGKEAKLLRRGYWYKTLCVECAKEHRYETITESGEQ